MLSCMLGGNREIFFPKLDNAQMMTFDAIATDLLHEYGYEVLKCSSDEEAVEKAENLKKGIRQYPVHFSASDTSGEKAFEEFYTSSENVNMNRLSNLGVITDKPIPDKEKLHYLLDHLNYLFERNVEKDEIIAAIKKYLPEFSHIETGKSLDNKM